eukprot:CAMPEP_0181290098 /NCGR_PEP_ID=MMETSP1101-20121128/1237_1 /TAXON_ID=46948 /ORGANISM="Rhodomonas abbreviata, Strain Caron Lab Isolate" /LENGTH=234 /DNA_ID=CAMNT_0023394369 /DNA_START=82 /DNA_END=783 /DNA_ORIENTATION=+
MPISNPQGAEATQLIHHRTLRVEVEKPASPRKDNLELHDPSKPKHKSLIVPMRLHMRGTLTTFKNAANIQRKEKNKLKISEYQDRGIAGSVKERRMSVEAAKEGQTLEEFAASPKAASFNKPKRDLSRTATIAASCDAARRPASAATVTIRTPHRRTNSSCTTPETFCLHKYPSTIELARLSMYMTSAQHLRLKRHVQQLEKEATAALSPAISHSIPPSPSVSSSSAPSAFDLR